LILRVIPDDLRKQGDPETRNYFSGCSKTAVFYSLLRNKWRVFQMTFWQSLLFFGGGVFVLWLLLRERSTDRPIIEDFVKQRGLRVISVTRSLNNFRYWLRGISVNNNARLYDVAVKDSEDNDGVIRVAFNSLLHPERLDVLEQQGSALAQRGESDMPRLEWTDRLTLFCAGLSMGGFFFCAMLNASLAPPNRPVIPDLAAGYTYLFSAKYGNFYGTFFEYWVMTYGVWLAFGVSAVAGLIAYSRDIKRISPTYLRQVFAAAAISFVLFYAIWRVFFSGAH
jgi:hypothetical protein